MDDAKNKDSARKKCFIIYTIVLDRIVEYRPIRYIAKQKERNNRFSRKPAPYMKSFYFAFSCLVICLLVGCQPAPAPDSLTNITALGSPAADGSRYPYLHHSDDATSMSWLQQIDSMRYAVQVATLSDGNWSTPETVVESDSFFVNWADFPSVVSFEGRPIAAHWLQKVPGGTYAYHVMMSFRDADGIWGPAFSPHTDGTPTEHGFVSMIALDSNRIMAVWLDGRNTGGGGHDDHDSHDGHDSGADDAVSDLSGAMTLRSAVVHRDGTLTSEHEIDDAICDCCQTSLVTVPGGAVVLYRDRSDREIRDIAIARYDQQSNSWSEPSVIHNDGWKINGCPVNGPRLAANGNTVAAVWFTLDKDVATVKAARSEDGGLTFTQPVVVDQGRTNGRVDVVLDERDTAWISWMGSDGDQPKLALRSYAAGGVLGKVHFIDGANTKRGTGFPRMTWTRDGIIMATTNADDAYQVLLKSVQVDYY